MADSPLPYCGHDAQRGASGDTESHQINSVVSSRDYRHVL